MTLLNVVIIALSFLSKKEQPNNISKSIIYAEVVNVITQNSLSVILLKNYVNYQLRVKITDWK